MQLRAQDVLGEVQCVRLRDERQQAALVQAVVEEQLLLPWEPVANWRRRRAYFVATARATLAALTPAPPTLTRPWTRVPSMVKKRRSGLSIVLL